MLNVKIKKLIEKEKKKGEFIYPYYDKYCFSNIPSTILSLLDVKSKRPVIPKNVYEQITSQGPIKKVVLFLIDGFGYKQWAESYKDYELFKVFTERGVVSPITTVFPSTTSATLTTMNTGLTPQEHGLPEWYVYFRELDNIIATLPFRYMDGKEVKGNAKILFKGEAIYHKFRKAGIKAFVFIKDAYSYSEYSKLAYKGAILMPYKNLSDLVVKLRRKLKQEKGAAYFYVYIDDLDAISHEYGPYTEEYYSQLSLLSYALKNEFLEKIDKTTIKDTLVIITADHGQLNIEPKKIIYINKFGKLNANFKKGRKGKSILPSGSPRDVLLHIKPGKLDETISFLSKKLDGKAKVMKTEDAIKEGLFGMNKPSRDFIYRVGNILILPYKNNSIWYEHIKGKKFGLLGHHGGLSTDEMLIPFAIARLEDLIK